MEKCLKLILKTKQRVTYVKYGFLEVSNMPRIQRLRLARIFRKTNLKKRKKCLTFEDYRTSGRHTQ